MTSCIMFASEIDSTNGSDEVVRKMDTLTLDYDDDTDTPKASPDASPRSTHRLTPVPDCTDMNGNVTPLTIELIDALDEVFEAIGLAEDNSINTDGLEDIEEIKDRMRCHVKMKNGSPKEIMDKKIRELGEADRLKKATLCEMVQQVKKIFPSKAITKTTTRQSLVEDMLERDGTTDDIREDCDKRIASLKEKECVILVAGESSAGKSSLLNLLLGESILPYHMLPCTSCITVIRYNSYRCAKIKYHNGEIFSIPTLDKAGLEQLQSRSYFSKEGGSDDAFERRKHDHDIAEIQVFLPLDMLHSGLVLVDTPGIGENEFLENYLMEYINSRQILGFMYIIMTDNALGIAEDRLVNLMSLIIKSQKNSSDIIKFDPNAALFVCNRWDMVPVESRKHVRASAIKQLGKCWPDFDPNNVVFFSSKKAERETRCNPGYITDEYVALLYGINKLVEVSLDKRIKASYRWLGTVLQRSIHYIKTMVRSLDLSGRKRQDKTQETMQKLKTLRHKAKDVVEKLEHEIEEAVQDICSKVREHLATPNAKKKLTKDWGKKEGELPDMETASVTWSWIKRHIEAAFNDRLTDLLEDWDRDKKEIHNLEKKLFRDAKLNLCELENDLADIENAVRTDDSLSRTSSMSLLNTFCRSIDDFDDMGLIEDNVPSKLLYRIKKIVPKMWKKKKDDSKIKEFRKSPSAVAQKKAEEHLISMLKKDKDNKLEEFVRDMMFRVFNYVKRLDNKIPNMINTNMNLLDRIQREIVDDSKSRHLYVDMMERIETSRRDLIGYGESHFFVNDFREDEIEIVSMEVPQQKRLVRLSSIPELMTYNATNEERYIVGIPYGIWHAVHIGKITKGSETQFVSVKLYTKEINDSIVNPQQEVAKLRCLLHSDVCIAEFLGVYHIKDTPIPSLIYSGNLSSVKVFQLTNPKYDHMKVLTETLAGLQYLHSKGLVHMELTRETVTMNGAGEVCMTGACLPRVGVFPKDWTKVRAARYVYLAPEVLKHTIYISHADMYSFAIYAIEVLTPGFNAFTAESNLTLKEFESVDVQTNLQYCFKMLNNVIHHNLQEKLSSCLAVNMDKRPDAVELGEYFKQMIRSGSVALNTANPRKIWNRFSRKTRNERL